jgi:hypothetical protein
MFKILAAKRLATILKHLSNIMNISNKKTLNHHKTSFKYRKYWQQKDHPQTSFMNISNKKTFNHHKTSFKFYDYKQQKVD